LALNEELGIFDHVWPLSTLYCTERPGNSTLTSNCPELYLQSTNSLFRQVTDSCATSTGLWEFYFPMQRESYSYSTGAAARYLAWWGQTVGGTRLQLEASTFSSQNTNNKSETTLTL